MEEVVLVADTADRCGASPVWDPVSQALLWCDAGEKDIYRIDRRSGTFRRYRLDRPVASFARSRRSEWLLASKGGLCLWELGSASTRFVADPVCDKPDFSLRGLTIDAAGRCVVGVYDELDRERADGVLCALDHDGSVRRLDEGLVDPGGLAFSLDGRTLFVAERGTRRILAYEYDPTSGVVGDRELFVTVSEEEGYPEGLAVDASGALWSAQRLGWRITRYDGYGDVDRVIELPFASPTGICFGGLYLDELFVTTARAEGAESPPSESATPGALFRIRAGIRGVLSHEFRGILSN